MSDFEIRNAKIISTQLGDMDRGVSFYINLDFGGQIGVFGGYGLDEHNPAKDRKNYDEEGYDEIPERVPSLLMSSLLIGLHTLFPYKLWETLTDTPVRVYGSNTSSFALGHFLKDKWLYIARRSHSLRPEDKLSLEFLFKVTNLDDLKKYIEIEREFVTIQ